MDPQIKFFNKVLKKNKLSVYNFLVLIEYKFNWELSVEENKELLLKEEQKFLDDLNPRYNILKIAGSTKGFKYSEEDRKKKISEAQKGNKYSEERRNKISKFMTRRFSGEKHWTFGKEAVNSGSNNPMFGKKHSPETLAKMRKIVYVYDANTKLLLNEFPGVKIASNSLSMSRNTY